MKTKRSILALAVLVIAVIACQSMSLQPQQPVSGNAPVVPVATLNLNTVSPAVAQEGLVALYERVSPGTVAIITDQGQGSGFVYDGQGNIVTNFHVIDGAKTIEVRFPSGFLSGYSSFGRHSRVFQKHHPGSGGSPITFTGRSDLSSGQKSDRNKNPYRPESYVHQGSRHDQ